MKLVDYLGSVEGATQTLARPDKIKDCMKTWGVVAVWKDDDLYEPVSPSPNQY
jgi:hypothetical protein